MNILFEIADKDLIFIGLAFVGLIIFAIVIFYIVGKDNRIKPISDEERFDQDEEPVFTKIDTEPKTVTPEQQAAKAELERVFMQMSADLETKQPDPAVIEEFEREQEESAIISYQELIKQAAKNKALNQEPKKSEDVLASYLGEPTKTEVHIEEKTFEPALEVEVTPVEEEPKKFRNSEIISPIFGIQSEPVYTEPVKKEAPAPRHAYEEIKVAYDSENNSDFLNSLKEFRNNL